MSQTPNRPHKAIRWAAWIVAALLLAVFGRWLASEATRPKLAGRDVYLLTFDTLRTDALGAWGNKTAHTPVIDGLAARGTRFSEATTPFPRTTPALASLLTGLLPKHHGSREVAMPIDDGLPMLAEVLQRQGYSTIGVVANYAASFGTGLERGFEQFEKPPGLRTKAREITDAVLALVPKVDAETPLFLWAHYVDPHFPYDPDPQWVEGEVETCTELGKSWAEVGAGPILSNRDGRAGEAIPSCRRQYQAAVARADQEVGRLLDGLRGLGRDPDQALVIFTADHGDNFGEGGIYYEHGPSVHDAAIHVPLIFAGPGIPERTDAETARLEDVAPTVLRLLDVPRDQWPAMDGGDLSARLSPLPPFPATEPVSVAESGSILHVHVFDRAIVTGRKDSRHCVHDDPWSLCGNGNPKSYKLYNHRQDPGLEHPLNAEHPQEVDRLLRILRRWPIEEARQRSARTPRFKLVEFPVPEGGYRRELYDLEADPAEEIDVSAEHPHVLARLGAALDRYTRDLPAPGEHVRGDEDVEALRALGYVD